MGRHRLRALLVAFSLSASALGCGAILGIEEEPTPPAPREGGATEASGDAVADAADAAATDAGPDVSSASDAPAE